MKKLMDEAALQRNLNIGDVISFIGENDMMDTRRITVGGKQMYSIELNGENIFCNEDFDLFLNKVQETTMSKNLIQE